MMMFCILMWEGGVSEVFIYKNSLRLVHLTIWMLYFFINTFFSGGAKNFAEYAFIFIF